MMADSGKKIVLSKRVSLLEDRESEEGVQSLSNELPQVGIDYRGESYLKELRIEQKHKARSVKLIFHPELEILESCEVEYSLFLGGQLVKQTRKTSIVLENPALWHPRGVGEQVFYEVAARVFSKKKMVEEKRYRFAVSSIQCRFKRKKGIVRLVFSTHGKNFFARGIVLESRSEEEQGSILRDAARLGSNLVRVKEECGYLTDSLLTLCDNLGLLVWQDVPGGGLPLHNDAFYLDEWREEQINHLRRYQKHPCAAVWVGNALLELEHRECLLKDAELKKAYDHLYYVLLPEWVMTYGGGLSYLPTTPWNPEGYAYKRNLVDPSGDSHISFTSRLVDYVEASSFVSEAIMRALPLPSSSSGSIGDRRDVKEAHEWEEGILSARLSFPRHTGFLVGGLRDGQNVCGLRDIHGRAKPAWFSVQKAFVPAVCEGEYQCFQKKGQKIPSLKIQVRADGPQLNCVAVSASFFSYSGELVLQKQTGCSLSSQGEGEVIFPLGKYDGQIAGGVLRLFHNGQLVNERIIWRDRMDLPAFPKPTLTLNVLEVQGNTVTVSVSSDQFAFSVWLDTRLHKGEFHDNFFNLLPYENKTVRVTFPRAVTAANVLSDLVLTSLSDES